MPNYTWTYSQPIISYRWSTNAATPIEFGQAIESSNEPELRVNMNPGNFEYNPYRYSYVVTDEVFNAIMFKPKQKKCHLPEWF